MSTVSYGERIRRLPAGTLPATARTFFYATVAAAVVAAAATSTVSYDHVDWPIFGAVLAGGALAQVFATHTSGDQVFHTGLAFSVAAALVLPPELVVVVCVLQHVPEWLRQRYPWFIQGFNIANVVLSGLAAWSVRAAFAGQGVHVTAAATTAGVVAASVAALTFVLVNHALLARMLRLARGHDLSASGLFTLDGLIQDGVVAAVGVGLGFVLLHSWALAVVVALPLVLIQRALALPTLREQALSDHKTGLLNSRGIDQPARSEFARARRLGHPLSVLLCDVDDLREINNRLGHLEGDAALSVVAAALPGGAAGVRPLRALRRRRVPRRAAGDGRGGGGHGRRADPGLARGEPAADERGPAGGGRLDRPWHAAGRRSGDRHDARARGRRDVRGEARRPQLVPDRRLTAATIPATWGG